MEASMRYIALIAVLCIAAAPAAAQVTLTYSWEDGGTVLGTFGNAVEILNVTGEQTGSQGSALPDYTCPGAYDGDRYLHFAEDPHSGTPNVLVAWITGLVADDAVTVSFYGYDTTLDASPSLRIWGGYTDGDDANNYLYSAGSTGDYTAGTGWNISESTWAYAGDVGGGIQIQARAYSTPSTNDPDHTDYWVDYVTVTAPATATIHFPESTPVESSTWSEIKALYR
jgi:hypothetical protein